MASPPAARAPSRSATGATPSDSESSSPTLIVYATSLPASRPPPAAFGWWSQRSPGVAGSGQCMGQALPSIHLQRRHDPAAGPRRSGICHAGGRQDRTARRRHFWQPGGRRGSASGSARKRDAATHPLPACAAALAGPMGTFEGAPALVSAQALTAAIGDTFSTESRAFDGSGDERPAHHFLVACSQSARLSKEGVRFVQRGSAGKLLFSPPNPGLRGTAVATTECARLPRLRYRPTIKVGRPGSVRGALHQRLREVDVSPASIRGPYSCSSICTPPQEGMGSSILLVMAPCPDARSGAAKTRDACKSQSRRGFRDAEGPYPFGQSHLFTKSPRRNPHCPHVESQWPDRSK